MATPIGFDPSVYNSTTADYTLGASYWATDGREFRYVKALSALAVGDVCCWTATTPTSYTVSQSKTAPALDYCPAGIAVGTITSGNYGFILVKGYHASVKDAANACTAGAKLRVMTTTAGNAQLAAAATDTPIGTCIVAGSGGVCGVAVSI